MPEITPGVTVLAAIIAVPAIALMLSIALPAVTRNDEKVTRWSYIAVVATSFGAAAVLMALMATGVITDTQQGNVGAALSALVGVAYLWSGQDVVKSGKRGGDGKDGKNDGKGEDKGGKLPRIVEKD